jgi:hypothetical protein
MSLTNKSFDAGVLATPKNSGVDPSGLFAAMVIVSAGTVSFVDQSGNSIPASGTIAAGTELLIKGVRINATGTTATVLLMKAPA